MTYHPHGLGPIRIPQDVWDREFDEIEPIYRDSNGRKLKRYRHKLTGVVCTEQPMDQTFDIGEVKVQPMKAPVGGIFYMDFTYGKPRDDRWCADLHGRLV